MSACVQMTETVVGPEDQTKSLQSSSVSWMSPS